jgi:ABC-type multidrug transport system ATPase subunit
MTRSTARRARFREVRRLSRPGALARDALEVNLALALLHGPLLLLLDEPYADIDWDTYMRFWEMAERRRETGMGILIVSHLLTERERLTRIYELRDGRCEVIS